MPVAEVTDSIIEIIKRNLIAKTNVTSDVTSGSTVVNIENAFQYKSDQEVILIDYGYNNSSHSHYQVYEYARIKEINNTNAITLYEPLVGDWLTADNTFIQKTIGHSPLTEENIYYGDREVLPTEDMAITVETTGLTNEWIYLQGGLNEEYRARIVIYGKDIANESGRRVLDKYTDATYQLLNDNLHFPVDDYHTPLIQSVTNGDTVIIVEDTTSNQDNIKLNSELNEYQPYLIQDNQGVSRPFEITNIDISGGQIRIMANRSINIDASLSEFAILRRQKRYFYDSRVDSVNYGEIFKGSAYLMASELSWFGKEVNRHSFPQPANRVENFERKYDESSSSSSGP